MEEKTPSLHARTPSPPEEGFAPKRGHNEVEPSTFKCRIFNKLAKINYSNIKGNHEQHRAGQEKMAAQLVMSEAFLMTHKPKRTHSDGEDGPHSFFFFLFYLFFNLLRALPMSSTQSSEAPREGQRTSAP